MNENQISNVIIGASIEVHKSLGGPGLLESVYEEALVWELRQNGLYVDRQIEVPITYKDLELSHPLKLDLLVEKMVIVENKSSINYNPIYEAQALTYLRLLNLKLALVINFGEKYVKNGVHRVINGKL